MNIIDKTIAAVSPNRALRREIAKKKLSFLDSGYSHHGASRSKKSMQGWRSRGGSPKEDIDDNLALLRERSRDLYMGVPIATGALKTIRTNVVGSGLKLKSQIDADYLGLTEDEADAWEKQVEREFALWADSTFCDAARQHNFYELQQIAFLASLMSGECFALLPHIKRKGMPYGTSVQLLEADRVCTPTDKFDKKIINGIEVGKYGEVKAYHIAKIHPSSQDFSKQSWTRVRAYGKKSGRQNILHLFEAERPEQRRGVPILSPVVESLKQLGRYTEAELMAAVVSGMFTVFITSENPNGGTAMLSPSIDSSESQSDDEEISYKLGNGSIIELAEGESIKESNPGRPNAAFDGFVVAVCRQIGAALEVPFELLVKHFTSSYSASRAALLEAWKMFRMRRAWMSARFCQPIFEEWLTEAISLGRISAPGFFSNPLVRKAYCGSEWNGPTQGQLDPLKEVKAAGERVAQGFSTRAKETVELTGGNFIQNARQRTKEEKLMKEEGGEPNE